MRKIITIVILSVAALSGAAFAAGNANGHPSGMPANSQAVNNSNGIRSVDRDKGLDRAADRRNAHSLPHKRAKKIHNKKMTK